MKSGAYLDYFGSQASQSQFVEQIDPGKPSTDDQHVKRLVLSTIVAIRISIVNGTLFRVMQTIGWFYTTDISLHRYYDWGR